MDLFTQAVALSSAVVLVITELAKLVPVEFTSKYPAWVNGILSLIASVLVVNPDFVALTSVGAWLGTALLIAVTSAIAYNQWSSKVISFTGRSSK